MPVYLHEWISYYLGVACRWALIVFVIRWIVIFLWNHFNGPKKPKL